MFDEDKLIVRKIAKEEIALAAEDLLKVAPKELKVKIEPIIKKIIKKRKK